MTLDKHLLDRAYQRYGYEVKSPNNDIRVYVLRQGVYYGADVVPLSDSEEVDAIRDEYSKSGFACRICRYETEREAEEELFKGFFASGATSARLKAKYSSFVEKQSDQLGAPYQYIPCPYRVLGTDQSSQPLIDNVFDVIKKPGAQLLILEAAAGYGKTCSAYEVLATIIAQQEDHNPLITELSRNRQAKIFRYVLLDEIDLEYPSLNSELVQSEIQSGRIPLIIDGFDELLYKELDHDKRSEAFEEVESMLETIGQLLQTNAKIVLTTRRTAIFSGDEFHNWIDSHGDQFSVTRFLLEEPDIERWLGVDKIAVLESSNIPIHHLANPVLLAFLRNLPQIEFEEACEDSEIIIRKYFNSLLDREQERQAINLNAGEQLTIFRKLAEMMIELNITAESREFMQLAILDWNRSLLEKTRQTYPASSRPSVEQLADTLANHALLNRIGGREDRIGFINEFVFGTLIGDVISAADNRWIEEKLNYDQMIELAVTAYRVRNSTTRQLLWDRLSRVGEYLNQVTNFNFDMVLCNETKHDFVGETFDSLTINDSKVGGDNRLNSCVFINCTFNQTRFVLKSLDAVGFLTCTFNNCSVEADGALSTNWERACTEYGGHFLRFLTNQVDDEVQPNAPEDPDLEVKVLENFWHPGRAEAHLRRPIRVLLAGIEDSKYEHAMDAIESLRRKGILELKGDMAFVNKDKLGQVKEILGR